MNNKQEWLEKVKIQSPKKIKNKNSILFFDVNTCLFEVPEELKNDYDINFAASIVGHEFLWNIHEDLRDDKKFILSLMENGYKRNIYDFLSKNLKQDEELFIKCLERDDSIKRDIEPEILNNKDVILKAMKIKNIYKSLDKKYDLDKDVMKIYFDYMPEHFIQAKKSVFNYFNSLKRKSYLLDFMNNLSKKRENPCRIYNFLSDDVMRDMDLIDVLLKFDPNNIKYVPKDLREDHSFIKNVIEKYKVNELEPIFNNNKELITKIIEKNGKYLKKFSQYINDIDMVKLALKTYNHIDILTPNMLENKELVLDILKKDPSECKHLFSLKKYVNDLDVMKLAIKHDHKLFYHSNSITDIEILNYVVEKTEDFALVIKEQIQNKELMFKLINNKENINLMMCNQNFIYKYKNDIEIVQKIISIDPTQIEKFPKFKKDKDIIFYALQCGLSQINKIDVSLYHDIDIVNSFIKKNSINYINLPLDMKNNHEIALRSINNNKDFFMVINNSELEQDISFYIKAIRKKHELFEYITENNDLKLNEKIILGYIESCHEKMLTPQIPIDILDNFKCRNVTELKIFLLKNQIEKELNNTNNSQIFEEKKNKIKI